MALWVSALCAGQAQAGGYGTVQIVGEGTDAIKLVKVGGTRYEMGYWYGRILANDIANCWTGIQSVISISGAVYDQAVAGMWDPNYFDTAAYEQELSGMAAGCAEAGHPELTFEELRKMQLLSDITELNCSLFAAWGNATADGHLYQFRNLDWSMDTGIQDYPVVTIYDPNDGNVHAVIGFAGLIGIAGGGINEHGITQSQIMGWFGDPEQLVGVPFPILLREILYHDSTVSQAVTRIQSASRTNNYYYGIGGPDGAGYGGRLLLTSSARCDVYTDNQSVNPHPGFPNAPYHESFDDVVYWNRHDGQHNQEFHDGIAARHGSIDHTKAIELAQLMGVDGTLLSVVYDGTAREFWVAYANGLDRATNQTFVHFDLTPAEGATALDSYVAAYDPSYAYTLVSTESGTDPFGNGYTAYVIRMTSQRWRTEAEVDHTVWEHWLLIMKPDNLLTTSKGIVWIEGGSYTSGPPSIDDGEIQQAVTAAITTGSVVSVVLGVPNQPLYFTDETRSRGEDAIIAYSFKKFGETGDETWPALLPMVKSVVRGLDTIQTFISDQTSGLVNLQEFVVSGGSKRGWTTWLTAAVDPRVVAIAPAVIDLLNLDEQMVHHFDVYGFYAPAIHDYVEAGVMEALQTPEGQVLLQIVDPYEYRGRFASIPKFLINSTGDQFFVPDSAQFYFDDLVGEKVLRYVPNTDHGLGVDDGSDATESLLAFWFAALHGVPRPQITWTLEGHNAIRVQTTPVVGLTLTAAKLWQATVQPTGPTGARDFRLDTTGKIWTSTYLTDQGGGSYLGQVPLPPTGWTGFFVELTYDSPGPFPYKVTTQVRVVPEQGDNVALDLQVVQPSWGHVDLDPLPPDPNVLEYPIGRALTMTAVAEPNYVFVDWTLFDPNHPGDANYAAHDPNAAVPIIMSADRQAVATFGPLIAPLVVTAAANPEEILVGGSSVLTATAVGGLEPYTYLWSTGQQTQSITVDPNETTQYTVTVTDDLGTEKTASVTVNVTPPVMVTAVALPDTITAGGSSTLRATVSGGVGPYTYSWDSGQQDSLIVVTPGETTDYTVTVTDSLTQQAQATVTVTVASAFSVAVAAEPDSIVTGASSTVTATPSGGSPPYTYVWNTGATDQSIDVSPTSTTSYTVTASDSLGQVAQDSATVTVSSALSANATASPSTIILGANTTLTASPSGGKGPYTYAWSNGKTTAAISESPSETTTYTVTITDALQQQAQASATVTVAPGLTVSALCDPATILPGGSCTLRAQPVGGAAPYLHTWSTGQTGMTIRVSPTATTVYTVTTMDALGQTAQAQVTAQVAGAVTVTASSSPSAIHTGESSTLSAIATGGKGPYAYAWSNGASVAITTVSPKISSKYTVTVTDSLGQKASASVSVTVRYRYALTVDVADDPQDTQKHGQVSVDPVGVAAGSYVYEQGTQVTLTATADKGYRFAFWGGDLPLTTNASGNPVIVVMDEQRAITAVFVQEAEDPTGSPTPLPGVPGCGGLVGTGQLAIFWALCWIGLGGWAVQRARRRR